jgi:hypothetical protein
VFNTAAIFDESFQRQSNPDLWRGHESDIAFWKKISARACWCFMTAPANFCEA